MMKIDRAFCVCFVTLVCASLTHASNDEWKNPTNGGWLTDTNWANGFRPLANDQATFDKAGTYTVAFDTVMVGIQDLFVSGGNVTLNNPSLYNVNKLNINSASGGQDVVVTDGATFTLSNSVNTNNGLILNVGDTLFVQTGGTLNVYQGSAVTAANLIDNFGGNIVVDGKSVDVGQGSSSSLLNVSSSATVGALIGTSSLSYRNFAQGSLAPNGTVFVGSDAAGILNIDTQAAVEVGSLKVGTAGATGTINVNYLGTTLGQVGNDTVTVGASLGSSSGTINVGTIASGGTFTTGTGLMTVNATGTVNVGSASTSGTLNALGNILISGGTINVTGGTLHANNVGLNGGQLTVGTNGVVAGGPLSIAGGGAASFAATAGLIETSVTGSGSLLSLQSATDALDSGASWNLSAGGGLSTSGDFHLNSGTISIDGAGSAAIIAAAKTLRIGDIVGTTTGVMNVTNEGALTVGAGGTTVLTNHGTLNINGGTVDLKTLSNSGGRINLMAGSLSYLGNLTVGTGGPLGSNLVLNANSQLTLSGATTVDASRTLTLSGGTLTTTNLVVNGAFNFIAGTLTITQAGAVNAPIVSGASSTINLNANNVSLGLASSFTGFDYGGALNVGPNSVTLNSATYARLGTITTFAGGTIAAPNGIAFATGSNLLGHGAVTARIAAELGSVIQADGALALGDASSPAGYASNGELRTKQFAVTLNSSAQATLGNLTTLGNGTSAGTLNATNGLVVDLGHSITGFGTINSTNALAKRTIINGTATGTDATHPLTFTGYVKGVGTFNNVNFAGTFSPGLSPTMLTVGSVTLATTNTLIMELGGTTPGDGYDEIQATGSLSLAGTLQVALINGFTPATGQSFDLLDWGTLSGTFASISLPTLSGLTWNTSQLYTAGVISVASAGLSGDYNNNGTVDAADYVVWRGNQGTTHVLANDPIGGTIGIAQYNQWRAHFGQTAGSGASAEANVAVPEPATIVMLITAIPIFYSRRRALVS